MTCIFAIFAASWDLLAGYTGQVNFGHALFFGAGAYASALLLAQARRLAVADDLGRRRGGGAVRLSSRATSACACAARTCRSRRSRFRSSPSACLFAFPDFSGGELGVSGLQRLIIDVRRQTTTSPCISMLVVVFGCGRSPTRASASCCTRSATTKSRRARRASTRRATSSTVFAISGGGRRFRRRAARALPARRRPFDAGGRAVLPGGDLGIFGGVATIYGPVVAVFILYPLTEWLGSFRHFGELRLLIFAVIVLLVLLFMPRGLTPWVRDKVETQCPRCKQRNGVWQKICRLCGAPLQTQVAARGASRRPSVSFAGPSAMMRPCDST